MDSLRLRPWILLLFVLGTFSHLLLAPDVLGVLVSAASGHWKTCGRHLQLTDSRLINKLKSFASPNSTKDLPMQSSVVSHSNITQKHNNLPSLLSEAGGPMCPGPRLADALC